MGAAHPAKDSGNRCVSAERSREIGDGVRALATTSRRSAINGKAEARQLAQRAGHDRGTLSADGCVCGCHRAGPSPGAPHDNETRQRKVIGQVLCTHARQEHLGVARDLSIGRGSYCVGQHGLDCVSIDRLKRCCIANMPGR